MSIDYFFRKIKTKSVDLYLLLHIFDVDLFIIQQIVGTNFNLSDMFHFNTGSVQIYS